MAIQWPLMAINGHEWPLMAIKWPKWPLIAIMAINDDLMAINGNLMAIKWPSWQFNGHQSIDYPWLIH